MKQFVLFLLALTMPATLSAAETQQQRVARSSSMYRLNFTLHVMDGEKDQPRNFALVLEDRTSGKIRALTKIPVKTGAETNYIETGIKTDAEYTELEGRIRLQVELQYTGVAGASARVGTPTTRSGPSLAGSPSTLPFTFL